jgi:hypothetical protein
VKSLFVSKTFWINALTGITVLAASPQITDALGPDGLKWVLIAQSVANVLLRLLTSQPVSVTGTGKGE